MVRSRSEPPSPEYETGGVRMVMPVRGRPTSHGFSSSVWIPGWPGHADGDAARPVDRELPILGIGARGFDNRHRSAGVISMRVIGNILWLVLAGFWLALGY